MNCATCGRDSGTLRECHDCWEIESRLTTYLRTEKGRFFVLQKLREIGALPPVYASGVKDFIPERGFYDPRPRK